jgi:hypothetical protein
MRLLILLLFISSTIEAQNMEAPKLEFVCELKVTTDKAMTVGETAHGTRRIIPITGGTFEGPKLKGIVLNGGADYQFVNKEDTRTEIEAIYTIKTNDSILIHIRNTGIIYRTPEAIEQLSQGQPVDWNKIYFRAAPRFEAPIGSKYDWMNNAIFICKAVPEKGYVSIQVWKVN